MKPRRFLAMALHPTRRLAARGCAVDRWQRETLHSRERRLFLHALSALGALRYLVACLDAHFIAKRRTHGPAEPPRAPANRDLDLSLRERLPLLSDFL